MRREYLKKFLRDTSGGTLIYVGLIFATLVGFTGLGIDVAHWYSTQRSAQSAADAAAIAGGVEAMWGGDASAIETAAEDQAALNGFDASMVTVNIPPSSGPNTGDPNAVEVIIEAPTPGFFSSVVYQEPPVDITARSVAAQVAGSPACIVALEPTATAFTVQGGSAFTADGCMLQVNSTAPNALMSTGGSSITADEIAVTGDYTGSGYSTTPETGTPPMADPLAYLQPPASAGDPCDFTGWSSGGGVTTTISEGVYCDGLEIGMGSTVTLNPGLYVIRNGQFNVGMGSTNSGTGVTIYLTGDAVINLGFGADVDLSAPTMGDLAGVLFFQDRSAPPGTVHLFNSGSGSALVGTVYLPTGEVRVASGSTLGGAADFTSFVAKTFDIESGSHLVVNSDYEASSVPSVPTLSGRKVALYE